MVLQTKTETEVTVKAITMKLQDRERKLQDQKFVPLDFVVQKILDVHSNPLRPLSLVSFVLVHECNALFHKAN